MTRTPAVPRGPVEFTRIQVKDGSVANPGTIDLHDGAISLTGNVDGVNVSAHASRHENGGADEISVAGLSGLLADSQTPLSHGASLHTNRTRYIWLPPRVFGISMGTPALALYGVSNSFAEAWAFDATAEERIGTAFVLPADYAGGVITVFLYWAADTDTNTAHNVRWGITEATIIDGDSIDELRESFPATTVSVPSASVNAKPLDVVQIATFTPTDLTAGSLNRFIILRNPTHAADDMTGDGLVLGVRLSYTSDE